MRKSILVTGATGTVGLETVKSLAEQNANIKACVHNREKAHLLNDLPVELCFIDYNDSETIAHALENVDKLFLLIPSTNAEKEIEIATQILSLSITANVNFILQLSGIDAPKYGDLSHAFIEKLVNQTNIHHAYLRPNFFMQNFGNYYINDLVQHHAIRIYDGGGLTSFIDARDIGAVAAKILLVPESGNKTYTLTGCEQLNHEDIAKILTEISGKTIQMTAQSHQDTETALREQGWPESAIKKYVKLYHAVERGDFAKIYPEVKNILGREPIKFRDYAKTFLRQLYSS